MAEPDKNQFLGKNQGPDWPEFADFVNDLIAETHGTNRGTILISTAMIEAVLKRMLERFFADDPAAKDLLRPNDPLGTFGARTRVAFVLGLITQEEVNCLNFIRKIRNKYAHELGSNISEEAIEKQVNALLGAMPRGQGRVVDADASVKDRFADAVILLAAGMVWRFQEIDEERRKVRQS